MQEFCLPLTYLKLDWASGKSLTTTLSSQEHLLLINNLKFELQCLRQSELNVLTLRLDWARALSEAVWVIGRGPTGARWAAAAAVFSSRRIAIRFSSRS